MCVLVLLLVLVIDNQIKRALIAHVAEARTLIHGFEARAGEYVGRAQPEGDPAAGADHADSEPDSGVGGAAAGRADVGAAESGAPFPKGPGRAGTPGGPRGNG